MEMRKKAREKIWQQNNQAAVKGNRSRSFRESHGPDPAAADYKEGRETIKRLAVHLSRSRR